MSERDYWRNAALKGKAAEWYFSELAAAERKHANKAEADLAAERERADKWKTKYVAAQGDLLKEHAKRCENCDIPNQDHYCPRKAEPPWAMRSLKFRCSYWEAKP